MDGWNTFSFAFGARPIFRGKLAANCVSFRECIRKTNWRNFTNPPPKVQRILLQNDMPIYSWEKYGKIHSIINCWIVYFRSTPHPGFQSQMKVYRDSGFPTKNGTILVATGTGWGVVPNYMAYNMCFHITLW